MSRLRSLEGLLVVIDDEDARALVRKSLRGRQADAAGRARDHDALAFQFFIMCHCVFLLECGVCVLYREKRILSQRSTRAMRLAAQPVTTGM